jgi:hypothetical protein
MMFLLLIRVVDALGYRINHARAVNTFRPGELPEKSKQGQTISIP